MAAHTFDASRPWVQNYAIFLKPEPESQPTSTKLDFVGFVGAIRLIKNASQLTKNGADVNGSPEFGYMLMTKYQRKGLGTEAVKGFLEIYWGLEKRKGVERLVAVVDDENVGSVKVLENVGAERLGEEKSEHGGVIYVLERPNFAD
jgi:RimJ/RimL family protein N-acetyltransferase